MASPKYEHLKQILIQHIDDGRYKTGDQIPPQSALEREFGVSRITVRRATADLIAAGELEHRPGRKGLFVAERARIEPRARTIAVAIDDVTDRFGATILRGIEDYLWQERYHTIICNADRDFAKVTQYFESFDFEKVDGVIFAPVIDAGFQERNRRIAELLIQKSMPFVVVDRTIDGVRASSVTTNDREAACRLTESLLRAGHERILLGAGIECSSMNDRETGFRDAYAAMELQLDENLVMRANDNLLHPNADPKEVEAMESRIRKAESFSAFYALNDRILNAGIASMQHLGIDVGSIQLALHNEVSKPLRPFSDHIPRVIPPLYKMGRIAARTLLDAISDGGITVSHIVLENELNLENLEKGSE